MKAIGDPSRITARVLPSIESLRACEEAGLAGRQILAMQGPFDTEMNCAMIRFTVLWLKICLCFPKKQTHAILKLSVESALHI